MARDHFPDTDGGLLGWSLNFSTRITAEPVPLGLTPALATSYAAVHAAFATAMAAVDPGVPSKASVIAKNNQKKTLKIAARQLIDIINGQPDVSDEQKIELGINVKAQPVPVPIPSVSPGLDVLSVVGALVKLADS